MFDMESLPLLLSPPLRIGTRSMPPIHRWSSFRFLNSSLKSAGKSTVDFWKLLLRRFFRLSGLPTSSTRSFSLITPAYSISPRKYISKNLAPKKVKTDRKNALQERRSRKKGSERSFKCVINLLWFLYMVPFQRPCRRLHTDSTTTALISLPTSASHNRIGNRVMRWWSKSHPSISPFPMSTTKPIR